MVTTILFVLISQNLMSILTFKFWLQEAVRCKTWEVVGSGLGGAVDTPLEWAFRKFWHWGLIAGLATCMKYVELNWFRRNIFTVQGCLSQIWSAPVAGPSLWMEHSGTWRRSKELLLDLGDTVLSQPPALCSVSGSPSAGAHSLYQSHVPAVL